MPTCSFPCGMPDAMPTSFPDPLRTADNSAGTRCHDSGLSAANWLIFQVTGKFRYGGVDAVLIASSRVKRRPSLNSAS